MAQLRGDVHYLNQRRDVMPLLERTRHTGNVEEECNAGPPSLRRRAREPAIQRVTYRVP